MWSQWWENSAKPVHIRSSSAIATYVPMPSDSTSIIQSIPIRKSVQSPFATKCMYPPAVSDSVELRRSSWITKPSTIYIMTMWNETFIALQYAK